MLKNLEEKYGDRATQGDKSTLENLRNEAARLEALVANQRAREAEEKKVEKKSDIGSENETEESVSADLIFAGGR